MKAYKTMEIEAKYSLDSKSEFDFWTHFFDSGYALGDWVKDAKTDMSKRMRSYYYDTDDKALRGIHSSIRIRKENSSWVLTVKQDVTQDRAVSNRLEWEWIVAGDMIDAGSLKTFPDILRVFLEHKSESDESLGGIMTACRNKELQEHAEISFERRLCHCHKHEEAEIEWAIDRGYFVASDGDRRLFAEMEFELKKGNEADLASFIEGLKQVHHLVPETQSKLARCLSFVEAKEH